MQIISTVIVLTYVFFLGWWSLLLIPFSLIVFHIGHSAYAHRIISHGIVETTPMGHLIGNILFTMCGWGSALSFGAIHANHHRYHGGEQDPHEPRHQGKWNVFVGKYNLSANTKFFKRKIKLPYVKWFHTNYKKLSVCLLPFSAPVIVTCFWMRYLLLIVVHGAKEEKTAQDKWWLFPLLWGDEMHELHHKNSMMRRHHKLDAVGMIVDIMEAK